jgi:hypothetical protein
MTVSDYENLHDIKYVPAGINFKTVGGPFSGYESCWLFAEG